MARVVSRHVLPDRSHSADAGRKEGDNTEPERVEDPCLHSE
jgi:hypothetical protein